MTHDPSHIPTPDEEARTRALDRARMRRLQQPLHRHISLDALRGWRERRDATLDSAHVLPALAHLTLIEPPLDANASSPPPLSWDVHAPELIIGRYNHSIGPVDLSFHGLLDYELYTITTPHLKLLQLDEQRWRIIRLSPQAIVKLNDELIETLHTEHPIASGDLLTLGVVTFRFDDVSDGLTVHRWQRKHEDLLRTQTQAAIFLKRHGGICGPRYSLDLARACVLGRSFPSQDSLSTPSHWPSLTPPDWDLSGLRDHERRHIAFRHAVCTPLHDQDWEISALSLRHEVTVNRIAIAESTPLRDGDEIGLGGTLFHFHNPLASKPSTRHTIKLPNSVDWHSEHSSLIKLPPLPNKSDDS